MKPEFSGIERRLDELNERLQRLYPLQNKTLNEFLADPYLRDIVERNLEIAIQCCIDIANRIISIQGAPKPAGYYQSLLQLGELGVLPIELAQMLAPMAGFRNVLVHEYVAIDWREVYNNLTQMQVFLRQFSDCIRQWMLEQLDPHSL